MDPRVFPSSRPGVEVEGPDGSSRWSTLLFRSTMREPLPSSAPAAAVKSAPSVAGCRWTEHTFRTDFRGQVCADAERSYGDMSGDPQGRQLLGRLARFLRLFEQRHSGGDGQGEVSEAPNSHSTPRGRPNAIGWLCHWIPSDPDDFSLRAMRNAISSVVERVSRF